jgi:hypothetical protein
MAQQTDIQNAPLRVPASVVKRPFPGETVALNLDTGRYHGLNPLAASMLAAVEEAGTIHGAVGRLAERYNAPADTIERDLTQFCQDLLDRGLIEIYAG